MILTKEEATNFLAVYFNGEHHFPSKLEAWGDGWAIHSHDCISTFDFNELTRLVVMAHDECIRVQITAKSKGRLTIAIHKRNPEETSMMLSHPKLEAHVEKIREGIKSNKIKFCKK